MEISSGLIIAGIIGFFTGIIIITIINKNKSISILNSAKKEAQKIIESATEKGENIKNNKILQAKEKFIELKSEHEKTIFAREDKIKALKTLNEKKSVRIPRKLLNWKNWQYD